MNRNYPGCISFEAAFKVVICRAPPAHGRWCRPGWRGSSRAYYIQWLRYSREGLLNVKFSLREPHSIKSWLNPKCSNSWTVYWDLK